MFSLLGTDQSGLARRLGLTTSNVSDVKYGRTIHAYKFWEAIEKHLPEWEPYLRGKASAPTAQGPEEQPPETGLAAPNGLRVVTVLEPGDALYVNKVQEILASEESATVNALKANIDQFFEKVQERKKLRVLDQRVADLEREMRRLRNSVAPSVNPKGVAEGE